MCCNGSVTGPRKGELPQKVKAKREIVPNRIARAAPAPQRVEQPRCHLCHRPIQVVNRAGKTMAKCTNPGCSG